MSRPGNPGSPTTASRGDRGRASLIGSLLVLAGLGAAVAALPLLVFLVVGFMPTVVAWIVDRDPDKYAAITVGSLTFAVMVPIGLDAFVASHGVIRSDEMLRRLMFDVYAWLMVYGGAGAGWILHYVMPTVAQVYVDWDNTRRHQAATRRQRQLIDEWGSDIIADQQPAEDE